MCSAQMSRKGFVGTAAGLVAGTALAAMPALADETSAAGDAFSMPLKDCTMEQMLDKFNVIQLVEYERFCRDNRLWEPMAELYATESYIKTSWYEGDAAGFIEGSKKMPTIPHKIHNVLVWLDGDKALAVMPCAIIARQFVGDVEYDLTLQSRLVYKVVREADGWKIVSFQSINESDSLVPVCPDVPELEQYDFDRTSNLYQMKTQAASGMNPDPNALGDDRPEEVAAFMAEMDAWLHE